jgi:hypothetical protein
MESLLDISGLPRYNVDGKLTFHQNRRWIFEKSTGRTAKAKGHNSG